MRWTTKKPSPWIIRSVARPVVWAEPWPKLVRVPADLDAEADLDRVGAAAGRRSAPPAPVSIWLSVSWKTMLLALKPTVLALAMLLPVTSSMVWLTRRPLMPAKSERSMVVPFEEGRWPRARRGVGVGRG